MPCFSGLVGRNVLDDSESRSLGAELLTSPRLRMLTMCRNGWTSVTEVGCALEKGAPVPLFLDYTTDQDLWHGSSRNLEAGEHCIRERRFPPMVILGSTLLQRKALNRRIPMTKIKKCSRSRQKKRPTRSRKPTYSPVFLRQWKKLSTIII